MARHWADQDNLRIPEGNTVKITRSGSLAAVALVGTLALAGCAASTDSGSSSSPSASADTTVPYPKIDSSLSGTITAGGSSAQANAETAWTAAFKGLGASGVTVNYDKSLGSGGGVTNWLAGSDDFVGSDAFMSSTKIWLLKYRFANSTESLVIPFFNFNPLQLAQVQILAAQCI